MLAFKSSLKGEVVALRPYQLLAAAHATSVDVLWPVRWCAASGQLMPVAATGCHGPGHLTNEAEVYGWHPLGLIKRLWH